MGDGSSASVRTSRALAARDGATPPLAGLLAGLRPALGAGTTAADRDALSGVADWPGVANLAAHHRVATLLLSGLRNAGVRLPDPEPERALSRQRRREVLRGMRQLEVMGRVTAALRARGIPSLVLKGLPLGQRVYGDPFAKSSIDIDLLVPDEAFAAAAANLRELGWRRVMPAFRETPARLRWYDSKYKEHVYAGGGTIGLHHRLFGNRYLFNPAFDRLSASALTVAVGKARFRTLGDVDQLPYLACHGSLHYWQRLKWLIDFAALLRAMDRDSVEEVVARGREGRFDTPLEAAFRLSRRHLHIKAPDAAPRGRADHARIRFVTDLSERAWTPRTGFRQLGRKVAMRLGLVILAGGRRYRLQEARGLLIRHDDFLEFDLPDRLFWLYACLQPLIWIRRAVRRR